MNLDHVVGLLANLSLFEGLSQEQLGWLAMSGEPVVFVDRRNIITEDMPGDAAYLILSGDVARLNGPNIEHGPQHLGAGTFIAEMAMLTEIVHGSTIITIGAVRAIKFRRNLIHHLMLEDPRLAEHFATKIRQRFLRFARRLKSVDLSLELPLTDPDFVSDSSQEGDHIVDPA